MLESNINTSPHKLNSNIDKKVFIKTGAVNSVNGKTGDVVLKYSDLENDNNTVQDENYVHTDNNFTNEEREKLSGLNNYDDTTIKQDITNLDNNKQDLLIPGTNIKTINGASILGSGDIQVQGSSASIPKFELVSDVTLEKEVSDVSITIDNVDEIYLYAYNDNGVSDATDNVAHYVRMWGQLFYLLIGKSNIKTIVAHGVKLGDSMAILDWGTLGVARTNASSQYRAGSYIPQGVSNNNMGINIQGSAKFKAGTRIRIWAKRRSE